MRSNPRQPALPQIQETDYQGASVSKVREWEREAAAVLCGVSGSWYSSVVSKRHFFIHGRVCHA